MIFGIGKSPTMRSQPAVTGMLLALLLTTSTATADKIYFKDGKFIEGIIKNEYPSRVELLFEGRILSIPRTRIDRLEHESAEENLQSVLNRATEAIQRGDEGEARQQLEAAKQLDKDNKFGDQIRALEEEAKRMSEHGTPEQRRAAAEKLLVQAKDQFDRIQIEKGLDLLLKSLETDPTFQPAHEAMAKELTEIIPPPVDLAIEYFSEYVDPTEMKENSPVVSFVPSALVELRKRLRNAKTEEEIAKNTVRMRKMTALVEAHPNWNYNPTNAQRPQLNTSFDDVIKALLEAELDSGNFDTALLQADAWQGVEPDSADLPKYFVRAWIGLGEFEKANQSMEKMMEQPSPEDWVRLSFNALANYQTAVDALKWGQDRQADGLLNTLLTLRGQLLPEIYKLIAATKFKYDEPQIAKLSQRGDPTGAADIALRAFVYAVEPAMILKARQAFTDLIPLLAFKPTFVWNLDGIDIPIHTVSTDILRTVFGSEYGLRFSEISPFSIEIRLVNQTYNGTGENLLAKIDDSSAYTSDVYETDDAIVQMEIHIKISHPVAPDMFSVDEVEPDLPAETKYGRKDEVLGTVYFNLLQHSSIDSFLQDDFIKYLPEDRMKNIYEELQIPEKEATTVATR